MLALNPGDVIETLKRLRSEDPSYSSGEVLGSMTIEAPQYLVEAFNIFMNTNLNDPKLFKVTHQLEVECINWLSKLMHGGGYGLLTYGGSESNLTALYALREYTGGDVVISPKTAHISIRKSCKVLGLNLIEVDVDDRYIPKVNELCELIRKYEGRLASVVMTAGTTDLGVVEPVDRLVSECDDVKYAIHVDAAYGGLIAPFIAELDSDIPVFDFRLSNVYSITVDFHKLVVPVPCSALLFRNRELEELITFDAPYMPSGKNRSLLGTRSGGIAAAAWGAIKVLDTDGFRYLARDLVARAKYLSSKLVDIGVKVLNEPKLPIVTFEVDDRDEVMRYLWNLKLYVYPTSIRNALRIVVGPHITYEIIEKFVNTLRNLLVK
ncbi:MAG: tyrosine decarboxylase MfnA [Sulfolobales archaeon]|nr:tyrosine decarboxylase MfnA [Sulfolobales archaeon]